MRDALLRGAGILLALAMNPLAANAQASKVTAVWVIVMENHNWIGNNSGAAQGRPDLKGSALAPYINGTLMHEAVHAERYFNPPGNHPSAPNYIWLEAGTNFGHRADTLPAQDRITSDQHLVHLLDRAGITWKAYAEQDYGDQEFRDCPLTHRHVDVSHVGVNYFADDTNDFSSWSNYCIAHVRPYSELATDLADHTVARYNLITPNLCHDGHEGIWHCDPRESSNNTLRSDTWLKENVPLITNSEEFKKGGVLFIVWDEGEDSGPYRDGPIGMFALSPFAKPGGYTSYVHYDHSSMLKTLQEAFGVYPLLGAAANPATNDLRDLFDLSKVQ